MEYLKTGDILICSGNRLISRLIKFFTKSKVSHTANVLLIEGQIYIIDAQKEGIVLNSFKAWKKKYSYTYIIYRRNDVTDDEIWQKSFTKRALSQSGVKYDYELLFIEHSLELIKDKYFAFNNSDVDRRFENNGKFVCSEFTMWLHKVPYAYKFTPQMVYEYVKNSFNIKRVN